MKRLLVLVLLLIVHSAFADTGNAPSPEAKGMPGALGTFEYKPVDWIEGELTFWKDTDGVSPGVAGCHIGVNSDGSPNGRMFAEGCMADGTLGESNPGINETHRHPNDTGHPDKFDCNAWCIGNGASSGKCVAAPAPPCEQSARCACDNE